MRFDLTTKASPEQVLRAMTDFTERRLEIWHKTLASDVYELRECGDTWAVAREGSPRVPFWVVVHYDWSDPTLIRWTEVESNHGEGGAGSMSIAPGDGSGSQVHVEWDTHAVRARDRVAMFLLHHTMNRVIARMWRKAFDRYAETAVAR